VLALVLAALVIGILEGLLLRADRPGNGPLSAVLALVTLLPHLAVSVGRLHGIDRTGWWLPLSLVPIVGALVLICFYVLAGTTWANRFGPPPPVV